MGNYNPHAPYILGHEWVPIRNAPYPQDHVTERGYTVRLDHTVVPVSGVYYIEEIPSNIIAQACDFISVYPAGTEDRTGPIRKLNIPASAVALSPNAPFVIDITEGAAALRNPTDNKSIIFNPNAAGQSDELWINFDTASYAAQLIGKRILEVKIRYALLAFDPAEAANNLTFSVAQVNLLPFADDISFTTATVVVSTAAPAVINSFSLTDLNPFWNAAVMVNSQRDIFPWRWAELDRFHASYSPTTSQLVVAVSWTSSVTAAYLTFADLEVTYCEENRVLYGGRRTTNVNISGALTDFYNVGPQVVRLRDPNFNVGATLTPSDYTVVISHRDFAVNSIYQGSPSIHAVREFYQLPSLKGVQVHQSTVEDSTFTVTDDSVITHITLHTAASIVTGVHAYGTSVGAPVYGSRTAIQEIEDDPSSGTGVLYPQVRFYARRFADTTIPLTLVDVATGTSTVSISPGDFDALPEIVDGWREVNLRFATPPTFPVTAGDVNWRWQATGEVVGNQWQILASSGPSIASPTPFATALATGPATYWAPNGSTVALTWQSPSISGQAEDTMSDAVLIFSQDPPAVTGFAITQLTQAVTGTGGFQECGLNAACIPAGIFYNRVTWTAFGLCDAFERTNVATWNSADSGQPYTLVGTAFDVTSGVGTITPNATGVDRIATAALSDVGVARRGAVDITINALPASGTLRTGIVIRMINSQNLYTVNASIDTAGAVTLQLNKRVANVLSTALSVTTGITVVPGMFYTITTEVNGSVFKAKIEARNTTAYTPWQLNTTDTDIAFGASAGAYARNQSAVTTHIFSYDNLSVTPLAVADGSLEVQRRDSLTDWQTIMLSTDPGCVIQLNDFEARVGVTSDYRMRTLNALDFAGPWVTGSGAIVSPGVVMAASRNHGNSVLMFTSNAQSASNLAYVMQFEGAPIEQFVFPEADTVSLQRLFGRDFFLAIRPLERGGERFSRTILVNAAAIPIPSLANFRGLRDLAWADLDYVCVRDELGNRWFATVIVPEGIVRDNRTVYLARIDVIEVTDTPTPVD